MCTMVSVLTVFLLAYVVTAVTMEDKVPPSSACVCGAGGTVNCSSLQLITIPKFTCETLDVLKLSLSWNNISVLEHGAFQKLITLQDLFLDHSFIRLIHKEAFYNLKDLIKLDLSSNQIQQLNSETFRNLENLQEINLRENPLNILPNMIFSSLKGLTSLDLSSCKFNFISEDIFRADEINYLSNEDITNAWPPRVYIDISDNPLHCNCDLKDFHDFVLSTNQSSQYKNLTCTQPPELYGVALDALDSADLKCQPYEILFPLRNSIVYAPNGHNTTLSCRIANDPHFPWLKRWIYHSGVSGYLPIPEQFREVPRTPEKSPRYIISSSNMWLNLTIENAQKSVEGTYTCVVYNKLLRHKTYRKVSLLVMEELGDFPQSTANSYDRNPELLVAYFAVPGILLSAVMLFLLLARRKPVGLLYKKRQAFKKRHDFMISVPFYVPSEGILPARPLPSRPGSDIQQWQMEYPEHLYEDIDRNPSDDHPALGVEPGNTLYDCEHYLLPKVVSDDKTDTRHTYISVLPSKE